MAVSRRLRFEILKRDRHTCRYCGASAPDVALHVDHVTPVALGGSDEPTNLVTACKDCNLGKSATSPDAATVQDVAKDAIRWARAIRLAAQEREESRQHWDVAIDAFLCEWEARTIPEGWPNSNMPLPDGWESSVMTFFNAGLTLGDIETALDKASAKRGMGGSDRWRYFCGICWSIIKDSHKRAAQILETEGVA